MMLSVGGTRLRPPATQCMGWGWAFGVFFAGPLSQGSPGMEGAVTVGWELQELRPPLVCPSEPPVLYPNLAELENYMGLALSSEEIQKNLHTEDSTVGVWAGSSLPHVAPHATMRVPLVPHPAWERAEVHRAVSPLTPSSPAGADPRRALPRPAGRPPEREQRGAAAGRDQAGCAGDPPVQGRAGQDGAAAEERGPGEGPGMAQDSVSWRDVTWHEHDSRAQRDMAVYHGTAMCGIKCHSVPQHSWVQMTWHGMATSPCSSPEPPLYCVPRASLCSW